MTTKEMATTHLARRSLAGLLLRHRWTWAHRAVQGGFLLALLLGRWAGLKLLQGSTASTRALGLVNLADPLGVLEVMLASRMIYLPLLLAGGIILAVYALAGRAYCAWICPLGLVLDLTDDVRRRFISRRKGRRFSRRIKYVALGLALLLSLLVGLPAFSLLSPINILSRNLIFGFGPEILLVLGIVAVDLLISRRAWCRYFCPLGAFYALIGRWGLLKVRVDAQGCTRCGHCTINCPMGINVLRDHVLAGHEAITDPECTRCGTCLEGCEGNSLHLSLSRRS